MDRGRGRLVSGASFRRDLFLIRRSKPTISDAPKHRHRPRYLDPVLSRLPWSGVIVGGVLGIASCVGLLLGDSGESTPAGWVILLGLAGLIGAAIGIPLAFVIVRLARALAERTSWWLPGAISAAALLAGTATCLNVIDQSAGTVVSYGLFGFLFSAVAAWATLSREPALMSSASVKTSAVAGTVSVIGGAFVLMILCAHRFAGDDMVAFSPAALVVYVVVLALPLTVLAIVAGTATGLLRKQRS